MFGNMCIGATHTESTNQRTDHPNLQRSVCGRCKLLITLARISTPFPTSSTPHRCYPSSLPDLFASLPISSPVPRPLLHLSPTSTASAYIGTPSRIFRDSFRPESIPPPETSRNGGGDGGGRPEGAVIGIGTQPRQFSYRTT